MKISKSLVLLLICVTPLAFRNVFITLLGSVGNALSVAPLIGAFLYFILKVIFSEKIEKQFVLPYLYIIYGVFCASIFPLIGIVDYGSTPMLGFFQLFTPLILALFLVQRFRGASYSKVVLNVLITLALINAIGGLIQFFYSPNIFGLISNRVYDGGNEHGFTKRAISFLASPQSLSIYLAFCLPLVRYYSVNKLAKIITFLIILFCGVLTGSKAFFVFLFVYFLLSIDIKKVVLAALIGGLILVPFFGERTGVDTFDRILDIPMKIVNLDSYLTFQIWCDYVLYPSSLEETLFGRGIGVMSTSSQTINNYKILVGSTESFLVQLYFEIGIFGLLLFLFMYTLPPLKLILNNRMKPLALSLLALLSNMAFSPAFYGFSTACLFLLAYSICLRNNYSNGKCLRLNDSLQK
jgi:hypothetical protein